MNNHVSRWLQITFLILITSAIQSCNRNTINVSTVSYPADDTSFHQDTLQGYRGFPETGVYLRSLHDKDSLYLEIKFEDRASRHSVLVNGLTIWIDPKAQKNENYGMTFTAARSEMFRRREEIIRELEKEKADSATIALYTIKTWIDAINQREVVVTDVKGTRFSDKKHGRVYQDDQGHLVYTLRMSFNQLGITPDNSSRISVGIISQIHQAQLLGASQGGVSGPPGTGTRRPQGRAPVQARSPQVPINSWILVEMQTPTDTSAKIPTPSGEKVTENP